MARKRTIILMKSGSTGGGLEPLGTLREVREAMAQCNIAPDGSGPFGYGERMGTGVLFGPGMVMEVPLSEDPTTNKGQGPEVTQVLVQVTDEDFGFPVLMRLCKINNWKMMDPDSGRTFG